MTCKLTKYFRRSGGTHVDGLASSAGAGARARASNHPDRMAPHDLFPPLPFVTSLEGIGGCIKASASDFCVTEVGDPSEPCADGKHAHVTLTRSDLNTRDVQQRLAKLFSVQVDEIGVAGLKDRTARVTQTFSLPRERLPKELRTTESTAQIAAMLRESAGANGWVAPAEEPSWHRSKLKKGHLVGNRFEIIISQVRASDGLG
jgi:tRNA pseudouridine13 synthase